MMILVLLTCLTTTWADKCPNAVRTTGPTELAFVPYSVGRYVGAKHPHYSSHYNFQDIQALFEAYLKAYGAWHSNGTLLDVGGRNGEMAAMAPEGYNYAILERDPPSELAAKKFQYYSCDLYQCALPTCLVEIIFCQNVLEHLVDPHTAFKTMSKLLKPGGLLLLRTQWLWRYHATPSYGDYFRYSARGLEYLCLQAGLNPVNSGYQQLRSGPQKLVRGRHPGDIDVPPVPLPLETQYPTFVVCYKPRDGERSMSFDEVGNSPVEDHPRFYLAFDRANSEMDKPNIQRHHSIHNYVSGV